MTGEKILFIVTTMSELQYKLVASKEELEGAFKVRREVFVDEQGVAKELEFDGYDEQALHLVVVDGQGVIATARIRFLPSNEAKLERMAILKPYRRRRIGTIIINYLIEELRKRQVTEVILHAQYAVVAFYRACGFEEVGLPFCEAGIKHIVMKKQL